MACPYFRPDAVLDGVRGGRAPLGALYSGRCEAGATVLDLDPCNYGYPRHRCSVFPESAEIDAVRFSALSTADAEPVELVYVLEKEYSPKEHGRLTYSRTAEAFTAGPEDPVLRSQALAFIRTWIRI